MEGICQLEPPGLGKFLRGVGRDLEPVGHRGEKLGVMQELLAATIRPLRSRLARVCALVILVVELAHDAREIVHLFFDALEEDAGCADVRPRYSLEVMNTFERLDHPRRRPAAPVTMPERNETRPRSRVILEVSYAAAQLMDSRLGVVCVDRWKVRDDFRTVDALPDERVMRLLREAVIGELLSQKAPDTGSAEDLGELAVVAERVR